MLLDTPKKVLLAMAQVFSDYPALFTVKAFARNSSGAEVPPSSNDATCFCARGFLKRLHLEGAATKDDCKKAQHLMNDIGKEKYEGLILIEVNDYKGREAIIKLALDTAAKIKE